MSKVSPEFLPNPDRQKMDELERLYNEKYPDWVAAIQAGENEVARRIDQERQDLLTELRMINPNIPLTGLELGLINLADMETKIHHEQLNEKKLDPEN